MCHVSRTFFPNNAVLFRAMMKGKGDCLLTREIVAEIAFNACSCGADITVSGEDFSTSFGVTKGGRIFDGNTI